MMQVITSFVAVAAFTIVLSAIPAIYKFADWWDEKVNNHAWLNGCRSPRGLFTCRGFWEKVVNESLDPLCDLQIVTGTAILIAGFVQWKTISFYHEQFIVNYWWLTLNSFWAAETCIIDEAGDKWRNHLRRGTILTSVVLFCACQGLVIVRERDRNWDSLDGRLCYRTHDQSPGELAILWLVGAGLYGITLLFTFRTSTRERIHRITDFKKRKEYCKTQYEHLGPYKDLGLKDTVKKVLWQIGVRVCWIMPFFGAIWSYGSTFGPLVIIEIVAYFGLSAWSVFDIIDLKLSNKPLLDGSESTWGFGQVLPVVLLMLVGFKFFESIRGA
jgi:hypothetical protein